MPLVNRHCQSRVLHKEARIKAADILIARGGRFGAGFAGDGVGGVVGLRDGPRAKYARAKSKFESRSTARQPILLRSRPHCLWPISGVRAPICWSRIRRWEWPRSVDDTSKPADSTEPPRGGGDRWESLCRGRTLRRGGQQRSDRRGRGLRPEDQCLEPRTPLPKPRGGINAVEARGCLHVFGGEGNTSRPNGLFDDHDVYDPATRTWGSLAPMPIPVHGVTGAAFLSGLIYLPGGGTSQGGSSGGTQHQVYRPRISCR